MSIIALEGIDASGKATQTKKLVARLQADGFEAERFDFPHYESRAGRQILSLLKREWRAVHERPRPQAVVGADADVASVQLGDARPTATTPKDVTVEHVGEQVESPEHTAFALQCLMTVNRFEYYDYLKSWQHRPKGVLVLDRYYASGVVYGSADGLDAEWLLTIHRALPSPDLWVLVDVPPEASVARRPERRDEYETREGFMAQVRSRYLDLFKSGVLRRQAAVVDGNDTVATVHERIWEAVRRLI